MARPFPTSPIWPVIDWLGDHTALPVSWIIQLITIQWAWGDTVDKPTLRNLRIVLGPAPDPSLYYNGILYVRFMLPFFVGIMIRWGGKDASPAYLQTHLGWKINGRLALVFRLQSDSSAAVGMDAANTDQSIGWLDGRK